jgi:hypothetical protein
VKPIAILVTLFLGIHLNAQVEKTSFAEKVKIRDKKKTVGYIVKFPGLSREISLKSFSQKKDSTGSYITQFNFYNPSRVPTYDLTIVLQFDEQIDSVYYTTDKITYGVKTTIADNNLGTSFQASHLAVDAVITTIIKSKSAIITTITGISPVYHFE